LVLGSISPTSETSYNLQAFQTVQYSSGLSPYLTSPGVKWERVSSSVIFDSDADDYGFAASSLTCPSAPSGYPTVTFTLTAEGLTISAKPEGAGNTLEATIVDRFGVGFNSWSVPRSDRKIIVQATDFSARRRLTSNYLTFSVGYCGYYGPSCGDIATNFTFSGSGWNRTSDVTVSYSSTSPDGIGPIEVFLQDPDVGLSITASRDDLRVTLGQPGTFVSAITSKSLCLVSDVTSDVYIDSLQVPAINESNARVKVIAGEVSGLSYWTVDLTVRVNLNLSPFSDSYPPSPVDLRRANGPLTLSQDATIDVPSNRPLFLNSSWFPGSRYYLHLPWDSDELPALPGAETDGWPGVFTFANNYYVTPLVCGVDCGKFEALLKDYY
jgi:hypothetical protein